jgi:hypothetical protein
VPGKNVFNVGSHEETSIASLAALVVDAVGSSSTIEYRPYTDVFPGRVDVTGRVPSQGRLHDTIGATRWQTVPAIVADLARDNGGEA